VQPFLLTAILELLRRRLKASVWDIPDKQRMCQVIINEGSIPIVKDFWWKFFCISSWLTSGRQAKTPIFFILPDLIL
jgi:hypothetical protein